LHAAGRQSAAQHSIQDQAERVDVCAGGNRLASQLFWRGKSGRQASGGGLRRTPVQKFGNTEIQELGLRHFRDHNIAGLQVTVHYQFTVCVLHGGTDLFE
jgi:hypothetical protein